MRNGSQVRIIPGLLEGNDCSLVLWDDPPDFTSIYRKNHVGKFHYTDTGRFRYTDTGIVLEQRYVSDGNLPLHVQTAWIKVLCSSGIGWIKRCYLELVG